MCCWITALSRRSTPPQRQQKDRLLCLAGGKQLGTDDAGRGWFTWPQLPWWQGFVVIRANRWGEREGEKNGRVRGGEVNTNFQSSLGICLCLCGSEMLSGENVLNTPEKKNPNNRGISVMSHRFENKHWNCRKLQEKHTKAKRNKTSENTSSFFLCCVFLLSTDL